MRRNFFRLGLLTVVGGAILWAALNRDRLDPAVLDAWLSGLGMWAPVAHVLAYAAGTVVFAPGSLFALAGGALFGPVWGTLLNLTGATIGAGLAFVVARYLAGDWAARKAGGRLGQLVKGVEAEGWRFVAFVRLVPLFPFNLTNYALGLTRIGLLPYLLTSFITMAPGALAYTWLGHAGREALEGNAAAIRYGLLALGVLAAIAFVPRLVKYLRGPDREGWITAGELAERLSAGEALTLLDVRSGEEFTGPMGHIDGALNIPVEELPSRLGELAGRDAPIVAICRTDRRSAAAQKLLTEAGFEPVTVLEGGMTKWNALNPAAPRARAA
jgi:uncharacterized membrane protein YdjX (TVP38/TMEM64 family)/rhodanese-related sulfurtransferase